MKRFIGETLAFGVIAALRITAQAALLIGGFFVLLYVAGRLT